MDHFTLVTHDLFLQNVDIFSMNFVDILLRLILKLQKPPKKALAKIQKS